MTLDKVIRAQEEVPTSQSGSATTLCLRQSHAAHKLHSDAIHRPGHSSGRLASVFVLRLNVPNVFALIPKFTILRSNKERALYDSNLFLFLCFYESSDFRARHPGRPPWARLVTYWTPWCPTFGTTKK